MDAAHTDRLPTPHLEKDILHIDRLPIFHLQRMWYTQTDYQYPTFKRTWYIIYWPPISNLQKDMVYLLSTDLPIFHLQNDVASHYAMA